MCIRDSLNVEEMGKVVCSIEITEDSNITSSNYKESITNMEMCIRDRAKIDGVQLVEE